MEKCKCYHTQLCHKFPTNKLAIAMVQRNVKNARVAAI